MRQKLWDVNLHFPTQKVRFSGCRLKFLEQNIRISRKSDFRDLNWEIQEKAKKVKEKKVQREKSPVCVDLEFF